MGAYDTPLTPEQLALYQKALGELKPKGRDVSADQEDYDLQGLYAQKGAKGLAELQRGHGVDTFKKPNHPTFSEESQYSTTDNPGGHWGELSFVPSPQQMQRTPIADTRQYFKEAEPGYAVVSPPVDEVALAAIQERKRKEVEDFAKALSYQRR